MGDGEERSDGVRAQLGAGRVRARGAFGWIREHALGAYAAAAVAYMLIPIAVIVLFSFNDPTGQLQHLLAGVHPRPLARPLRRPGAHGRAVSRA